MPGTLQPRLDASEVFGLLASLTDRSLVVPEGTLTDRSRLLETVRQYSIELLQASGEAERLRDRHRDYYTDFAERAAVEVVGHHQLEWIARLEQEHENLRSCLEWSLRGPGSVHALRVCRALVHFWHRQGHLVEARQWCQRALGSETGRVPTELRAGVLNTAGWISWMQGDYAYAGACYVESYAILKDKGPGAGLGQAILGLGLGAFGRDDYALARQKCEEAWAVALESRDKSLIAFAGYFTSIVKRVQGDYDGAIQGYQSTIAILREIGDRIGLSYPLYDVGLAEYYQGNFGPAETYHEESLAIRRTTRDKWGIAESQFGLGLVSHGKKEYARARACFSESIELARQVGDRARVAICLHWMGRIALEEGDAGEAAQSLQECAAINRGLGDRWSSAHMIGSCGSLAASRGEWLTALKLWSAECHQRDEIGSPLPPVQRAHIDREAAAARAAIPDAAAADAARDEGLALTFEQALELAEQVLGLAPSSTAGLGP